MDSYRDNTDLYNQHIFARVKPLLENADSPENLFCYRLLNNPIQYSQLQAFLEEFILLGWDRVKLNELTRYVQFTNELDDSRQDYLADIMSLLTGFCRPDQMLRFSTEPADAKEFDKYFDSIVWGWESFFKKK